MGDMLQSVHEQLTEVEENLRLIQERKAEYVLETDVPLLLIKDERRLEAQIADLRARLARLAQLRKVPCPYRGLEPFEVEHAEFYFGRDPMVERLVAKVDAASFVAVVGPSGCGKSSLVRAGLVTALRQGALPGSRDWVIRIFRPGRDPLRALAAGLVALLEPEASEVDRMAEASKLADHLREGTLSMDDVAARLREVRPDLPRLLLVADQFEELYTECDDGAVRRAFVNALLAVAETGWMTVVLALRADFYGRVLEDRALGERVDGGLVNVLPMDEAERRAAIEGPALAAGRAFEPGLVERFLDDVADAPGDLPLLEFALTELWARQTAQGLLTHAAYEAIGEVQGAVARRAETVYGELEKQGQGETVRRIFLRLTHYGEGAEGTRRRATLDDMVTPRTPRAAVEPVVKVLADARLLVTGRDEATGAVTVEVAHEALIRGWERLQRWLDEDRAFGLWRERLAVMRQTGVLLRDAPLAQAEDWLDRRGDDLNEAERTFIEKSLALRERERTGRRQLRQRVIGGLVTALIIISILAVVALLQRNSALELRKVALAQELATSAGSLMGEDNELALLLALESVRIYHTFETEDALRRALRLPTSARTLLKHPGLRTITFSPDGTKIATAGDDTFARVWSWPEGNEVSVLQGHTRWVVAVDFSPDGKRIVTASIDGTAKIWDATTGDEIATLHDRTGDKWQASFSPDGDLVLIASSDGSASLWDAVTGNLATVLPKHGDEILAARFSPDGDRVVTASKDGTAHVWDIIEGRATTLVGHEGWVWQARFNSDGRQLVTASIDGTARIWDTITGDTIRILTGHGGPISTWTLGVVDAGFSPDDQLVVTAGDDGTARVWDPNTGGMVAILEGHKGTLRSALFRPQGDLVLTKSYDGTVRVWDPVTGDEELVLTGVVDSKIDIAQFSPDGRETLTAGADGKLLVWEISEETGDTVVILPGAQETYSSDGKMVLTTEPNTVHVWDTTSWTEIITIRGGDGSNEEIAGPNLSPDGSMLLTEYGWVYSISGGSRARLWEVATGKPLATFGEFVVDVEFNSDGSLILARGWSTDLYLWNSSTLQKNPLPSGYVAEFGLCGRMLAITNNGATNCYPVS